MYTKINNLSSYKIIYATDLPGYKDAAETVSENFLKHCGVSIPVFADNELAKTENEILIGKTNRTFSDECYSNDGAARLMTYEILLSGNTVQLACGGPHSAKIGGAALVNAIASNGGLCEEDLAWHDLTTESVLLTEGADMRIMSINVLGECYIKDKHNGKHPASSERSEILAKLLVDYAPDIAGVQEMDKNFHEPMKCYFEILKQHYGVEYAITLTHHLDRTNDCPIIYRSDKYNLDHAKFVPAHYPLSEKYSTMYPCGVASAKFTSIEDPSFEVALISNHWHWEKEAKASDPPRQQIDAEDLAATVKELEAAYPGIHVFSTGDFNSHRFEEKYFYQYVNEIDGAVASTIAKKNGVLTPGLIHMGYLIDHIVGKKNTFDVLFHSITKNHSDILTDHIPIFADIKFI